MSPLTVSDRVVPSFWTPVHIECKQTDIFTAMGRLADAYLSLGSHTVHWKTWQAEINELPAGRKRPVWFSQEVFDDGSKLKSGLIKALKIASYLLLFPATLVPLAIKFVYKELYVKTFVNTLGQADATQFSFTIEAKRRLIEKLPEWLANHYPTQGQDVKDFLLGLIGEGLQDEEVDSAFEKLRETIISAISRNAPLNKTPIVLRTLTIPTQDAELTLETQHIVKEAWKRVIEENRPDHYAWANKTKMTYDSYQMLTKVLRGQPEDIQAQIRNKHLNVVRLYPRLNVQRVGETISVTVP